MYQNPIEDGGTEGEASTTISFNRLQQHNSRMFYRLQMASYKITPHTATHSYNHNGYPSLKESPTLVLGFKQASGFGPPADSLAEYGWHKECQFELKQSLDKIRQLGLD